MFHNISRLKIAYLLGVAVFLLASLLCVGVPANNKPTRHTLTGEKAKLVGRVLAAIDSMIQSSDLNCHYESFIFGAESTGEGGNGLVTPVEISHGFYEEQDGPLPESFYNHSKLYELRVTRTCGDDETVNDISYDKIVDGTTGKPLPPIKTLRLLAGAPSDLLKPDLVLPCYVMWSDGYKVLSQEKEVPSALKSSRPNPKGGTPHP